MNDHIEYPKGSSEDTPAERITDLLTAGRLEDAIDQASARTYSSSSTIDTIYDLKKVLKTVSYQPNGSKSALELVDVLVPKPVFSDEQTEWEKQYDLSFYDFVIQDLVISALQEKDFQTAEEIVSRMNDWYIGAAMGGEDLLEVAYKTKDPAVLAAVWALIAKQWGNGRATEDIPSLAASIDDNDTVEAINSWLEASNVTYRIPVV